MSATKWFKFYGGEYLSDPKIESLTPQERSCWVTLMCLASMSHGDGLIEFLTKEALLNKSGIYLDPYNPDDWDRALGVLEKFERMRMIKTYENGNIQIINWERRQETNLTDAERAKSYRDRKKIVTQTSHSRVTKVTQDKNRIDKNREDNTNTLWESFWEKYPPRRKVDKAKCEKKFCSFDEQTQKLILDDVIKRSTEHSDWLKEQGQFVPAPIVYLNKQIWETPIIKVKNNTGRIYG